MCNGITDSQEQATFINLTFAEEAYGNITNHHISEDLFSSCLRHTTKRHGNMQCAMLPGEKLSRA